MVDVEDRAFADVDEEADVLLASGNAVRVLFFYFGRGVENKLTCACAAAHRRYIVLGRLI